MKVAKNMTAWINYTAKALFKGQIEPADIPDSVDREVVQQAMELYNKMKQENEDTN